MEPWFLAPIVNVLRNASDLPDKATREWQSELQELTEELKDLHKASDPTSSGSLGTGEKGYDSGERPLGFFYMYLHPSHVSYY